MTTSVENKYDLSVKIHDIYLPINLVKDLLENVIKELKENDTFTILFSGPLPIFDKLKELDISGVKLKIDTADPKINNKSFNHFQLEHESNDEDPGLFNLNRYDKITGLHF